MKKKKQRSSPCACGSGTFYEACCAPYLEKTKIPFSAEILMRSRYTAYTRNDTNYLLSTWHPSTRPNEQAFTLDSATQWICLKVENHISDGDQATVEFVATYRIGGRAHRLHEISRFLRKNDHWYYVDGNIE